MIEKVAAQIAGDADEGPGGHPAGQPPQQIVTGDQREQQHDGGPQFPIRRAPRAEHVDQVLDPVLRADCAADRGEHGG